ncbi:MAG: MFS transporter [Actinomycetota bacterium]
MSAHSITLRELVAERDLRLLLGAQFLAQAADGIAQAVFADILVLDPLAQGTPGKILLLFSLTLLPYSAIAPFMGVFVDRWRRRNVLLGTNLARAVLLATLPLWARPLPRDVALSIGLLSLLAAGRLFLTTKSAVLPVLLHEHHLLRGNALSSGGGMICALAGGILGVVLTGNLPPEAAFAACGFVYLGAAVTGTRISDPLAHERARTAGLAKALLAVLAELASGARAIYRRAGARLPLVGIFILRTIGMFIAIAAILIIKETFPGTDDRFGRLSVSALALGAAGIGAFAGAVTAPLVGRRMSEPRMVLLGFGISGLAILVLGGVAAVPGLLALTFAAGYGGFIAKVSVDALVQQNIPDRFRGRAFSLYDILYNLASVAAALLMVATQESALRSVMILMGIGTLGAALLLGAAFARAGLLRAG